MLHVTPIHSYRHSPEMFKIDSYSLLYAYSRALDIVLISVSILLAQFSTSPSSYKIKINKVQINIGQVKWHPKIDHYKTYIVY